MVQISVQAVTPKPHTEIFSKLDFEYEKTCQEEKICIIKKIAYL